MKYLALFSVMLMLLGCERSGVETTEFLIDPVVLGNKVERWQQIHMKQSVASTTALANRTKRFLSSPGQENRDSWQLAWINAHEDFHRATLLQAPELMLNIDVWPIAPGFLDSLPEYPESGIIHDLTLQITSANLQEQHMITDRTEAALGFHVLEYYAFERDLADYEANENPLNDRRRELIGIVSDELLKAVTELSASLASEDSGAKPQFTYVELVATIANRVNDISSNLNYGNRHGEYGGRDAQVIRSQYSAISELLNEEVNINRYLAHLDEEQMTILNNTLAEAIELLPENGSADEAAMSRIQLLAAAISHQFDDFLP